MKKGYVFLVLIIFVISLMFIKPIKNFVFKSFINFISVQLDREETQRQMKIENNEIIAGKDTVLIWENIYEMWNHMGEKIISIETKESSGVILENIKDYRKLKNKLYITSEEGYAIVDKDKLCRVFVKVPGEEFVSGYSEDKEGNRIYISRRIENKYIKYLSSFEEFSEEEREILKLLKK